MPFEDTLFNKYYKTYVKEIFDPQRRLTTIKAYLPLSMTLNLTLADKIQIFENLYKINKLTTNFETNQTTFELINTKEQAGELIEVVPIIPDKFVPANTCITVDTLEYTVDDVKVKTDVRCNDEGLEITSTKEVVPDAVAPSNTPKQVLIDVALIVTPPTLESQAQPNTTNNSVFIKHTITSLGLVGTTSQIDEYGFFYSSDINDLTSTNVDTLKANSNVVNIAYRTSSFNRHTVPNAITFEVAGLSTGNVIYWKFYGRTNTSVNYALADAMTETKTSSAVI